MYNLPYFKAEDQSAVIEFMHQHSFVTLCGCDANNHPVATHVPVLIEEKNGKLFLVGHIMKKTDHHLAFAANNNVLAIFTGPHSYVSASWYTDQKQASTWNYMTVHAKGKLSFVDESALVEILTKTTAKYENNQQSPSLVEHLPSNYVQQLSKAIIGFEVEVTQVEHTFKLSQNKDKETYENIVQNLERGSVESQQVATLMKQRIKG